MILVILTEEREKKRPINKLRRYHTVDGNSFSGPRAFLVGLILILFSFYQKKLSGERTYGVPVTAKQRQAQSNNNGIENRNLICNISNDGDFVIMEMEMLMVMTMMMMMMMMMIMITLQAFNYYLTAQEFKDLHN
uniref:Uncharacterized protein n=1 Tax=Glossina pallidipes TaxID=7398 RepID=A0A1A9ZLM6_GLOPL